jgi:hypothetical protein
MLCPNLFLFPIGKGQQGLFALEALPYPTRVKTWIILRIPLRRMGGFNIQDRKN